MLKRKHRSATPIYRESGYARQVRPITRLGRVAWLVLLGLTLLCAAVLLLTKSNSRWVEQYYSLGFYSFWAGAVATLTGRVPFSLAEWIILVFALFCVGLVAFFIWQLARYNRDRGRVVLRFLLRAAAVLMVIFVLFTMGGGLNYYRYSFTQHSGLTVRPTEPAQLEALCTELAAEVNTLRAGLAESPTGGAALSADPRQLALQANASYQNLTAQNPQWAQLFRLAVGKTPPKPVFFSQAMSYMEIVGVFFPFTIEANVNVHTTAFGIPNAMCHELAHVAGFMREDEANFISYLACRASGEQFFRYSGTMLALVHSTNALAAQSPEGYTRVMAALSPRVTLDLAEDRAYYDSHHTSFGEFSNSVNDTFLRVNSQPDGVASYGRMVDLLLADYRTRHGLE